ncbi:hypothetical protein GCM10011519_26990 [Marmoricola endophyticus]|uniref:PqqD family protein n=1 Tax=Marmoricola endophyticus TaxID=2040280 RepID=A0A917BMG5_9ACTN|nr:PqqD family protein [Marmoricola endophyticus]GGF51591.1 hypothetical protein GCM10011519_26990 [Marmoricola endophyticus]
MTYAAAPDVAWTVDESTEAPQSVLLARMPGGEPVVLPASAAQIWLVALESRDAGEVVARMADLTGEDAETLDAPVRDLLDDLVGRGLLVAP